MSRLNPNQFPMQLRMFMSHNDMMGDGVTYMEGSPEQLNHKRLTSQRVGLVDSIAAEGVHTPIALEHDVRRATPELVNGHHRETTQAAIDPDRLMPVLHYSSIVGAVRGYNPPSWGQSAATNTGGSESTFDLESRVARELQLPDSRYRPARGY